MRAGKSREIERGPDAADAAVGGLEALEPRLLLATLAISEFMASNKHTLLDQDHAYSDWIEIRNLTSSAVDLSAYTLTDNAAVPTEWRFPQQMLPANSYLVVFASGKDRAWPNQELHTNFKLGSSGGYLGLYNAPVGQTPSVESEYNLYPQQFDDVAYGQQLVSNTQQLLSLGATARYLVPNGSNVSGDWTGGNASFIDSTWNTGPTALGFDGPPPTGGAFTWAQTGTGSTWHLYEMVTTSKSWIDAYNDAKTRVQGGVVGHLATITSSAEYTFVKNLLTAATTATAEVWLGLTDDSTYGGTEKGNTSGGTAPTEGQVPTGTQRGSGFVWVTGEGFTFHNAVWVSGQPNNTGGGNTPANAVSMNRTSGQWSDQQSGAAGQTAQGMTASYLVEYDLNYAQAVAAANAPNLTVYQAQSATALTTIAGAAALLALPGAGSYSAAVVNYTDPQNADGGHFTGDVPFPANTSADDNNFAVKVTGTLRILGTSSATYTFDVNSDDGFRLKITGATFTSATNVTSYSGDTMESANPRAAADSLGVVTLAPGTYPFELTYFEDGGGAGLEFSAAPGTKTVYDTTFKLVGDVANGGLPTVGVGEFVNRDISVGMQNLNPSVYVRIPFTVAAGATFSSLNLHLRFEDGFVAYLNGQIVAGVNAPDPGLAYNSTATSDRPAGAARVAQDFDLTGYTGALKPGATNILAFQVLNSSVNSTDLLLGPELSGTVVATGQVALGYFLQPTPGAANSPTVGVVGPLISNVTHTPNEPTETQPVVVTAEIDKAINGVDATTAILHYRYQYDVEQTLTMYDDGHNGDAAAGDHIYTATIPAAGSAYRGQMIRWYISVSDTASRASRYPTYLITSGPSGTGSAQYDGTIVLDPTVTSTLPIIWWYAQNPSLLDTGSTTNGVDSGGTTGSVFLNGEFFDNVWIRHRGGASTDGRKIHLNDEHHAWLDDTQGRVSELNINMRGAMDDAYIRPTLAFQTFADAGVPAEDTFPMRIQQNGAFYQIGYSVEEVGGGFLQRQGLYQDGLLYKRTVDDGGKMISATDYERKSNNTTDTGLQAFLNGLNLTGTARTNYLLDHVNVQDFIDYQVANVLVEDNDDAQKNYFLYQDTRDLYGNPTGTDQWSILPWDKDLTFGMNYFFAAYAAVDPQVHPFFGDSDHPKADGPYAYNWLVDAMLDIPVVKQMYLRRLRTVMDQFLQTADTPYADRYYETQLDYWYNQLEGAGDATVVSSMGNLAQAMANFKSLYLDVRRNHLFVDHSANTAYPDYAGIPSEQIGSPALQFGSYEIDPASHNIDQQYIEVRNPNTAAVDISGWQLKAVDLAGQDFRGSVNFTFAAGTVIPAGGSLYVSPDVYQFRARTTGPGGGQGLLVVGDFDGHLAKSGQTLRLSDANGQQITTLTTGAAPSLNQQFLRVTEVMYHPADPPASGPGSTYRQDDFEWLKFKNTSPTQTLNLGGVYLATGDALHPVAFTFAAGTTLAPGQSILVVANQAAFATRYGTGFNIAGQWENTVTPNYYRLSNGGDTIRVQDADNAQIQHFDYADGWCKLTDGQGFSLVARDPSQTLDLWSNSDGWRPSHLAGGSPGVDDPGGDPLPGTIVVNELLAHTDLVPSPQHPEYTGEYVELKNLGATAVDMSGWYLSDDPSDPMKYRLPQGAIIQPGQLYLITQRDNYGSPSNPGYLKPIAYGETGGDVVLTAATSYGGPMAGYQEDQTFDTSARETAFARYVKSTGGVDFVHESIETPGAANAPPAVGPVVISEIMYHPGALPLGTQTNGDEFIELANLTASAVPLYDPANPTRTWQFTSGIDFAFPLGASVPSSGYALVVPIDPATFRTRYSIPAGVPIYGPYSGALSNGGESLELRKPEDNSDNLVVPYHLVDKVSYNDSGSWPTGADGAGPALERKVLSAYGNDVANWTAGKIGGTPGAAWDGQAFDASAPAAPLAFLATPTTATTATLTWSAASDPQSSVVWYNVYRNGVKIGGTSGGATPGMSLTNVWPGMVINYQVTAVNADGVESAPSNASAIRIVAVSAAIAPSATTVQVTFTETVGRDTAQNPANYTVTGPGGVVLPVTAAVVQPSRQVVLLTLGAAMTSGSAYTVTASNVITRSGYTSFPGSQAGFTYTYVAPPAPGNLLREYWLNLSGTAVTNLTSSANYPDYPSGSTQPLTFEAPVNWNDNYGERVRGYVTAPQTGNYTFWIASDDNSELWLSTDSNPANKVKIASVTGYTNSEEWTKFASQQSVLIPLVAGQTYYIEALHKEGNGGDNLAVGWQLPDATLERPIPAPRLTPFVVVPVNTVSIAATTPTAYEAGRKPGVFTLSRTGDTTKALSVYYTVTGSAASTDTVEDLTGTAIIPAGSASATVTVTPVDDLTVEPTETVALTVLGDRTYALGTSAATVNISDYGMPRLTGVQLNGNSAWGPSALDPSDRGVQTITAMFSEPVTFTPAAVSVQLVANPGVGETLGATVTPLSVTGSGTTTMTLTLPAGAVLNSWVKVRLTGSAVRDLALAPLDGAARPGGSGKGYVYSAGSDLPSGAGAGGSDAVFYLGSLRGDLNGDGTVTTADRRILAQHYRQITGAGGAALGDVNLDGVVDILDLTLLAAALGQGLAPLAAGAPDPAPAPAAAAAPAPAPALVGEAGRAAVGAAPIAAASPAAAPAVLPASVPAPIAAIPVPPPPVPLPVVSVLDAVLAPPALDWRALTGADRDDALTAAGAELGRVA